MAADFKIIALERKQTVILTKTDVNGFLDIHLFFAVHYHSFIMEMQESRKRWWKYATNCGRDRKGVLFCTMLLLVFKTMEKVNKGELFLFIIKLQECRSIKLQKMLYLRNCPKSRDYFGSLCPSQVIDPEGG